MSERDERESPSGAMRGSGRGPGSPDMPWPRTDAEDTGRGDGGLEQDDSRMARSADERERERERLSKHPAGDDPVSRDADREGDRGADRSHGGRGDEGIGGGRAGGTGI